MLLSDWATTNILKEHRAMILSSKGLATVSTTKLRRSKDASIGCVNEGLGSTHSDANAKSVSLLFLQKFRSNSEWKGEVDIWQLWRMVFKWNQRTRCEGESEGRGERVRFWARKREHERERERECSEQESRDECIVYFNTKCTSHAEKHERLVF